MASIRQYDDPHVFRGQSWFNHSKQNMPFIWWVTQAERFKQAVTFRARRGVPQRSLCFMYERDGVPGHFWGTGILLRSLVTAWINRRRPAITASWTGIRSEEET